jgi:hypothetical protein
MRSGLVWPSDAFKPHGTSEWSCFDRRFVSGRRPELKPPTEFATPVRYLTPVLSKDQPRTWLVLFALLACGVFLYLEVFVLPATPRLATGDQAIYLHHASRMLEGQIIYRDYDHFTLPGTDVFYAALFKLFGVRAWIPQATLVLVGVVNAWLCIWISGKVLDGKTIFLPGFLFLTLPFSSYLDATHHWYSALAAVAALAIAIEKRTVARITFAGTLWGLATCFSQSMVLGVIGFALFLLWERQRHAEPLDLLLKKEARLLGGFLATVAIFSSYFVWKAGLRRFFYYTVVFVAKYYSADRWNTWRAYLRGAPSIHLWPNWPDLPTWLFIHVLIPFIYILFVLYYWRAGRSRLELPWERLMLVNITGLSLFLATASAPAYNRLYTVSLPGIILLVWLTNAFVPAKRILSPILWTAVVVLTILKPIVTQTRWKAYLNLPTGRTAFFQPVAYEKAKWVAERTQPSEYFFGDQLLCFALGLRNPARVPFLTPTDYTRPEEVRDVVQALEAHQVRFVSWYAGLDVPVDNAGNHLAPLYLYLHDHYHVGKTFLNGDKIWERDYMMKPFPSVDDSGPGVPRAVMPSRTGMPQTARGTKQIRN